MRTPDPKANTTTEAYLAYKAGYLEESELKPVLYEPYLHFDGWLAYWAGLTDTYPDKGPGKNLCKSLASSKTQNGVMMAKNADGTYTATGTPTGVAFILPQTQQQSDTFPAGIYTFSLSSNQVSRYVIEWYSPSDLSTRVGAFDSRYSSDAHAPYTLTTTEPLRFRISLVFADGAGEAINYTCGFQIEAGSTATEYEEYHLIPDMLCDEEALVAYLSGVTNTYPEEIKDPYDVRIVGYLKHLVSVRWPEPDYPVNNEEFYLSTMKPTVVPSGDTPSSDIEMDDTAEAPFIDLKMYGDTYQQAYSGKNLLNMLTQHGAGWSSTSMGVTFTLQNDGGIRMEGTSTGTQGNASLAIIVGSSWESTDIIIPLDKTKTYTISAVRPSVDYKWFVRGIKNGEVVTLAASTDSAIFTGCDGVSLVQIEANHGSTVNGVIYLQIEEGSTATSYEPYVGGIPAPNPDYPQDIDVVTGRQVVGVSGKNLCYETKLQGTSNIQFYFNKPSLNTITISSVINVTTLDNTIYLLVDGNSQGAVGFITGEANEKQIATITFSDAQMQAIAQGTECYLLLYKSNAGFTLPIDSQIEQGSTATDYQPYQSQSYEVNLGKNLIYNHATDKSQGGVDMTMNADGTVTVNGNGTEIAFFLLQTQQESEGFAPGTYTIKCHSTLEYGKIIVEGYAPSDLSTKIIDVRPAIGVTEATFTLTAPDTRLRLSVVVLDSSKAPHNFDNEIIGPFQLEAGSTSSSYAPYFEPIELCKIGDYQDYIYRDEDGDWYVHKACNSFDLADSPASTWNYRGVTGGQFYAQKAQLYDYLGMTDKKLVCNCFTPEYTNAASWDTGKMGINQFYAIWVATGDTSATTENQLITWFNTHSTKIYYPLATPTDTKITNSELISQLDALMEGGSYEGKTYIKVTATDPNLPGLLYVEAGKYD